MKVKGNDIPTIVNNPIICLGKWFDSSLTDNNQTKGSKPILLQAGTILKVLKGTLNPIQTKKKQPGKVGTI